MMTHRKSIASLLVGCCLLVAGQALAGPKEEAAEHGERARTLLGEAKFDEAMQAFRDAAKADKEDHTYRRMYAILRQVVQLREAIKDPSMDPKDWLERADALRSFYRANGLYGEVLPIDQRVLTDKMLPDAAERLAATQIELGKNADAVKTLSAQGAAAPTVRANVLHGLALARQGETKTAGTLAAKITLGKDAEQRCLYELARLYALLGNAKGMGDALTRCFKITPASQLDGLKDDAKSNADFAGVVKSAEFVDALKTKSTIAGCGRAGGCGGCAKKGGCSKDKGKAPAAAEKKGGCAHDHGEKGHDHGKKSDK